MPSSQAAANERRNERIVTHEPPKLKTTLKTPPKQATNPLQFVKVGPCSLYRTAQEQLQKVQEVKKIKPEVRDDPEDWQSNLDNWKSSRRKRQEHIIERVVEVKKLELEEHDRQRRRSKTFSEMMEERGSRGRKLSMSLAMYHEEDANDLSDLGIGTSSGKSSVSGDTHDDMQSVLSDRDSEIDKNHSDVENATIDNINSNVNENLPNENDPATPKTSSVISLATENPISDTSSMANGFHNDNDNREYDSGTTATVSSPEPEEYTYEGAIRGYVSRVTQNIPRRSSTNVEKKIDVQTKTSNDENTSATNDEKNNCQSGIKVDVVKRREIFEKASQNNGDNKSNVINNNRSNTNTNNNNNNNSNNINLNNNGVSRSSNDLTTTKSIKERLSSLEKKSSDPETLEKDMKTSNRLSGDMSSIRKRFSHLEKQTSERENKVSHRKMSSDELTSVRPLRERLATIEKYTTANDASSITKVSTDSTTRRSISDVNDSTPRTKMEISTKKIAKTIVVGRKTIYENDETRITSEDSSPSERSSSPDSEYRAPRSSFHRSLDSLDADGSSGPDTFERVQSLEELDYTTRYPASASSAEILNDTDREDSGIHTADVSCSVSQADETVDDDHSRHPRTIVELRETKTEIGNSGETTVCEKIDGNVVDVIVEKNYVDLTQQATAVTTKKSIVIDSTTDEKTEPIEETAVPVDHEEASNDVTTIDSPDALDDPMSDDSNLVRRQRQIQEINVEPEINFIDNFTEFPAVTNILTSDKSTVEKSDVSGSQLSNMDIFGNPSPSSKQIPQFNLASNEEFVTGMTFPLGPFTSSEPPKEKPPPPPIDLSDEENLPIEPLKRLNSTRRIKKELRTRRSDFLGIEGINDDDLERELTLAKPPDMAAILTEERRMEQLNRRSYDTDSNYEQDSSHERDSGVELGPTEDWNKQPVSPDMSQHSRQSSEPFAASVASSEEDEITKKEREIIEVLEKEEQWRYGNDREQNSDIGEKLAHKLRELEEEKMQLERERDQETEIRRQEANLRKNDENTRDQNEDMMRQQQLQQQQHQEVAMQKLEEAERVAEIAKSVEEKRLRDDELVRIKMEQLKIQEEIEDKERRSAEARRDEEMQIRTMENRIRGQGQMTTSVNQEDEFASGEVLRVERELLQLEQEELKRQRTNMAYREQRQLQLAEQLHEQWQSLQDVAKVSMNANNGTPQYKYQAATVNYRSSMPNLQLQEGQRRRPPPPPVPPSKPSRLVEQMQRDVTIRNSRIPSADSIPQQVNGVLRHSASATTLSSHAGQQMTKQTLHALSAVPRSRIVKGDQWVQRRKSDVPRGTQEYNYQHWLIQEAEQRRINEKNQRIVVRKPQQHVTGTSVPYTNSSSSRPDGKPLPDSIIQTLTQRVQNRAQDRPSPPRRRLEQSTSHEHLSSIQHQSPQHVAMIQSQKVQQFSAGNNGDAQEKMLSVSGKKKCSHCGDELGRGAAMIIESLRLFYHMECFKCCVCHVRLGDGLMGTDVRVRNHKLHCHNCYSSDDGVKFSCV